MTEPNEVRPARTWPHLSELQDFLVAFEVLGYEWVPGMRGGQIERAVVRAHVIDPPIGMGHQAVLVGLTSHVTPVDLGQMWVTATPLISTFKTVGRRFVAGRPYRYELRRGPRVWGFTTPTAYEFRLVDRYVEGLG